MSVITAAYGIASVFFVLVTCVISGFGKVPKLSKVDRWLMCWYAIAKGKSYSYSLRFAVSLGQLYGTALCFITSYLEGDNIAASAFYYNACYIGTNASWVVIPSVIAIRCWKKIYAASQLQQKKTKVRRGRFWIISSRISEV